jgi:hypothetical protein
VGGRREGRSSIEMILCVYVLKLASNILKLECIIPLFVIIHNFNVLMIMPCIKT